MSTSSTIAILISNIDGIELDCVFEERVISNVTRSKVQRELGTEATDHAILNGIEVVITAAISNHNINAQKYERERISNAYRDLISIQTEMRTVDLDLGISFHQNMFLDEFTRVRTNKSGQVLDFTAVFRESLFVSEQTQVSSQNLSNNQTEVNTSNSNDRIYAEKTSNAGSAGNTQIDSSQSSNQSILARVF